jgi:guanylate kinase
MSYCKAGRVISNTTRPKRTTDAPDEYRYFERSAFLQVTDWLWRKEIHANLYGTRKSDIDSVLEETGLAVIIIVHPCHKILKNAYAASGVKLLHLHILSPNESEVRRRLSKRGDSLESIDRRIGDCRGWDEQVQELVFVRTIQSGSKEHIFQQCLLLFASEDFWARLD